MIFIYCAIPTQIVNILFLNTKKKIIFRLYYDYRVNLSTQLLFANIIYVFFVSG